MKHILVIALLVALILPVAAQTAFEDLQNSFDGFAEEIAPSIPTLASAGLQWSDSWIGYFPRFGIGLSAGAIVIPTEGLATVFDTIDQELPINEGNPAAGLILPSINAEARIGGLILPFDVGIKYAALVDPIKNFLPDDLILDHALFGFDVRYRLLKEGLLFPELSVGAGYTRVNTRIGIRTDDIEIASWQVPTGIDQDSQDINYADYSLALSDPRAEFSWSSNIIDLKAQVSKKILILRPYAGAGVSFGISNAGGGLLADTVIRDDQGNTVTIDQVRDQFNEYGVSFPELDTSGLSFYGNHIEPSYRLFFGTSLELLLLKLDVSGMINPQTRAWGAQMSIRLQI